MRFRLAGVVIALLVGTAFATQDHTTGIGRIATWNDAIVVEMSSSTAEADGADLTFWWSIQKPAGTEQARIDAPYSKRPKLRRPAKSTIDADALAGLVAKLRENGGKKQRAVWEALASDLTLLDKDKTCPVRVKFGKKFVFVWAGKNSVSVGKSTIFDGECETDVPLDNRTDRPEAIDMRPSCFTHDNGFVVVVPMHWSCGGDQYVERITWIAKPE